MKEIVNGKMYNTATATEICDCGSPAGVSSTDFGYHDTQLYRTRRGAFFIAGKGGPRSMWAVDLGNGSWGGGSGVRPLSREDALAIAERHAATEQIEQFFDVEEA